ncbi:MAG: hypothetical protein NT078_00050 [Candidatus Azambacteria bacterium]|nr:hypothetical protein [Candidatus Azambacteria bacterium]
MFKEILMRLFDLEKKKTGIEKTEEERKVVVEYFNSEIGKKVFKVAVEKMEKGDNKACPLYYPCPVWFAKYHDHDYPNFFIDPCWKMGKSCRCPLKKIENGGCEICIRKINNNPLC